MKKFIVFSTFIPSLVILYLIFQFVRPSTISSAKTPGGLSTTDTEIVNNSLAESGDSPSSNKSGYTMNAVDAESDLEVIKTGPSDPIYTGEILTYTITVSNIGPSHDNDVVLTDTLPLSVTLIGTTTTQGTCTGNETIVCNLGKVRFNNPSTVLIVVSADETGIITNTAIVRGINDDGNTDNNTSTVTNNVYQSVDLSMSKTASNAPYTIGQPLTYTLVVTNNSPLIATNVTLTDLLPDEVDYVSVTPTDSCSEADRVVICDFGDLAAAGNVNATIVVTPTTSGIITNTAEVTATTYDPDFDNNIDSVTIVVDPIADLSLSKTGEPTQVYAGEPLTYTLTVNNSGPSAASGVILTDTLPGNVTFISVNSTQGTCAGPVLGEVVCNLGTIGLGSNAVVTIVVSPNSSVDLYNQAVVSTTTNDPGSTNNSDAVDTVVLDSADLELDKTVSDGPYYFGEPLTYTLAVTNNGPTEATTVTVTDTLPVGVSYVSGSAGCTEGPADVVVCDLGTIGVPGTGSATIVVTSTAGVKNNIALVGAGTYDPATGNNTSNAEVTVAGISDLELNKTVSDGPYYAGEPLTYTLVVTNSGPNDATSVTVTDTLPTELGYDSGTASGGCIETDGVVVCDLEAIGYPGTGSATIVVTPNAIGDHSNDAEVGAETYDPAVGNNTSSVQIGVVGSADLELGKTVSDGPYYVGEPLTYTLEVTNNGPNGATSVTVTDTLPNGVSYISGTAGCAEGPAGVVVCDFGTISAVSTGSATIVVTSTAGVKDNTALVGAGTYDPFTGNNTSNAQVTVAGSADLELSKSVSTGPYYVGEPLTYTLAVTNSGPTVATTVTVTDTLPGGVSYISGSAGCAEGPAGVVVCDLGTIGVLDTGSATIVAVPSTVGVKNNIALVGAGTYDPATGNNTSNAEVTVAGISDLELIKTVSSGPYYAGEPLTYTLVVTNSGPTVATTVTVTDTLPIGVGYVSGTVGCTEGPAGMVVCDLGTIGAPGTGSATIVVTSTVGVKNNTALVGAGTYDPATGNNTSNAEVTVVGSADLALNKTVSDGPYYFGEPLTYTLAVTNSGPTVATTVTVTDTLPVGVGYISGSAGCTEGPAGVVVCDLGTISALGTGDVHSGRKKQHRIGGFWDIRSSSREQHE
jgi:uncharacterized repeat protein (TIGR01451 family)